MQSLFSKAEVLKCKTKRCEKLEEVDAPPQKYGFKILPTKLVSH